MDQGKTHPIFLAAGAGVLVFSLLGAAALTGTLPSAMTKPLAQARCVNCGVVESIRAVEVKGQSSGVGAIAGGVAGGVVGNQFGHGAANAVLTVGGAAGGAFAGDAIERNMKKHTAWRVTIRLEDGSLRTLSQATQPPFAVGERVRIGAGNAIERA